MPGFNTNYKDFFYIKLKSDSRIYNLCMPNEIEEIYKIAQHYQLYVILLSECFAFVFR